MKHIVLFGAGKSATVLIDYLVATVQSEEWRLTVADAQKEVLEKKLAGAAQITAVALDINDASRRQQLISDADVVISLLPPSLHILVARDCLDAGKHLLTASYVDGDLKKLESQVAEKGLLFLCEMGLDPGIDHMSAKQMIDAIHNNGGTITSFLSHCGGLVAPESDNNPWHYKISWNPRNVVLAGKAGADFIWNGIETHFDHERLFAEKRFVNVAGLEPLCWYPNRDSLSYRQLYDLTNCPTFIRTTLRHPDFIFGWKNIIDLKLTEEIPRYEAAGKTLKQLFKTHLDAQGFNRWFEKQLQQQFSQSQTLLTQLLDLSEQEQQAQQTGKAATQDFMLVDEHGGLQKRDIEDVKLSAATALADRMHDAKLILKQLFFLGLDDDRTTVEQTTTTPAQLLQVALEKKLSLEAADRDMVVMLHEIEYQQDGKKQKHTASLVAKGDDNQHTAMAKTVGLPLGIAARLLLNGTISCRGLRIPTAKEIYEPVLAELERQGISFEYSHETLS